MPSAKTDGIFLYFIGNCTKTLNYNKLFEWLLKIPLTETPIKQKMIYIARLVAPCVRVQRCDRRLWRMKGAKALAKIRSIASPFLGRERRLYFDVNRMAEENVRTLVRKISCKKYKYLNSYSILTVYMMTSGILYDTINA